MRHRLVLVSLVALFFAGSYAGQALLARRQVDLPAVNDCRRIVTTAPSITETLFTLGAGERVVGVSRFCDYPPAARQLPQVGGFFDPNLEAIVALRPDLVVLLTESEQAAVALRELQIPTLLVCHQNLDGILESFQTLGRACGAEAESRKLLAQIQSRIDRIGRMTAARPRPRVMVVAGRALNVGKLEAVFVAAGDGHLDRLVELAGGVNAFPSGAVRFPTVAQEGILKINPDVIIDLVAEHDLAEFGKEKILADWQEVAEVEAVRAGRVCVLADDRATRPGPSFVVLLEQFARLIHPEIDWQANLP